MASLDREHTVTFLRLILITLVAMTAACLHKNPLYCDNESRPCTDPNTPFCDVAGEFPASEGIGNTCIPSPFDAGPTVFCEADAFIQCSDATTAIYCNAGGSAYVTAVCESECSAEAAGCFCEPNTSSCSGDVAIECDGDGVSQVRNCALGCDENSERCVDVAPSNDLGSYLDQAAAAPDVVLTDGATIDTDAGTIENGDGALVEVPSFQIAAPEGGVAVRVFAVRSLSMGDTAVNGARALAIVSDGDVLIDGIVRVLAGRMTDDIGRGHESVCELDSPCEFLCPGACGGAGGGGHGGPGAGGGDATAGEFMAAGADGGGSNGTAALIPLRGGNSGGRNVLGSTGDPANGGGAIQLVSRTRIELRSGGLNAGGQGGKWATGGGAGGGILLEAPRVILSSEAGLAANGGGGGGGCSAMSGSDGTISANAAAGAPCGGGYTGDGGGGGVLNETPGRGSSVSTSETTLYIGGAGGGSVGRLRINVPTSPDFKKFGVVSPAASVGALATR